METINDMLGKMVDNHETAIRELNTTINKVAIDLNVLITEHKYVKETLDKVLITIQDSKKKEDILFLRIEEISAKNAGKANLSKGIKDNLTLIFIVMTPFAGIIGTIMYHIGKYLN